MRVKLKKLDYSNSKRREIANIYKAQLSGEEIIVPTISNLSEHVFHLYVIQVSNRDNVIHQMNELGIFPGIHYPSPVHLQHAYKGFGIQKRSALNVTEMLSTNIVSLPMYPELSANEIERIVKGVKSVRYRSFR